MSTKLIFQEVLYELLTRRVKEFGRKKVAEMLGCSLTNLDYKRARFTKEKGKLQDRFVSAEDFERLARPGQSLPDLIKELYLLSAAMDITNVSESEEPHLSPRNRNP